MGRPTQQVRLRHRARSHFSRVPTWNSFVDMPRQRNAVHLTPASRSCAFLAKPGNPGLEEQDLPSIYHPLRW